MESRPIGRFPSVVDAHSEVQLGASFVEQDSCGITVDCALKCLIPLLLRDTVCVRVFG